VIQDRKRPSAAQLQEHHLTSMAFRTLALLACLALSSCVIAPHKMDVQQGNYIDQDMIAKLKPEMTRSQVRFLLGTPLLADTFHPERWDYLYLDRQRGKLRQERRLTLWFDGDKLKRAVTDTPGGPAPLTQAAGSPPPPAAGKSEAPAPQTAAPGKSEAPASETAASGAPATLSRAPSSGDPAQQDTPSGRPPP
jgi:outer membrane protein assembly factor BamE